jgi:IS30 family transposase
MLRPDWLTLDLWQNSSVMMLWSYRDNVRTITADNGNEFCGHELVAEKLTTDIRFSPPYSFWERRLSENIHGLLCHYIWKSTGLRKIADRQIIEIG